MDTPPPQADSSTAKPGLRPYVGWGVAFLVVTASWIGACALQSNTAPVHLEGWQPGLEAGMSAAQEADRPMLVMFTADWCGPCQALKKDVIDTAPAKQAIADGFVPVIIDLTDQSSSNPDMATAQRYGVTGIPHLILTDAQGNSIPNTLPYPNRTYPRSTDGFIDWLNSANATP
ncbi:MAG: thioredoxin family protein [Planctomycetota bacterium]